MRLKNSIDYKRFPEPSRGDWTRFTILVLSARKWLSGIWEPFFVQFCRTVVAPNGQPDPISSCIYSSCRTPRAQTNRQ